MTCDPENRVRIRIYAVCVVSVRFAGSHILPPQSVRMSCMFHPVIIQIATGQ